MLLVLLALAALSAFSRVERPSARSLFATAAFPALSLALYLALPSQGLLARYWGNGRWEGAPERSIDYRGLPGWTRIDRRLHLRGLSHGGGWDPFPVYFLDCRRYNFFRPGEPERTL